MKLAEFTSSRVYRSLAWSSIAMVLIMMTGMVGYRIIGGEQYSWIDCFYMTFITVATIGYGEIVDLSESPGGRLFTVFIATLGIGTMAYMLSTVTALNKCKAETVNHRFFVSRDNNNWLGILAFNSWQGSVVSVVV